MTEQSRRPRTRTIAGTAHVSIFMDEVPTIGGYPLVVPTYDHVDYTDLGDLVGDRIEGQGRVTLPDSEDLPESGETTTLGTVTWDDNGQPIRLERDDGSGISVEFDENGHVLQVTGRGEKQ